MLIESPTSTSHSSYTVGAEYFPYPTCFHYAIITSQNHGILCTRQNKLTDKDMKKWLLYNLTICFALYWTGNIILWYPWSLNAKLGIAMMLTIMPLLWGFGIYMCLIRYNGRNILVGSALTSSIMLINAVIFDFIFFGLIRGAFNDLYKPATFYGYAFIVLLPFIVLLFFRKRILRKKQNISIKDFVISGIIALTSLIIQSIIFQNS
ncbi:MAG: hypothetical protein B6D44_00245 [Ignavibacteriales bacterium UTCHB2]|jgi:hypothetical protein|nr:MAG: hypothetical protein B6D44_00245 [Ignavibacteriales bacterium UTCHB2]